VNQVMGDGLMALFGAPLAHEDHAVRACYAALRMQESAKRYAEEAFRSHGISVRIREPRLHKSSSVANANRDGSVNSRKPVIQECFPTRVNPIRSGKEQASIGDSSALPRFPLLPHPPSNSGTYNTSAPA
jgi:hypothetical protein